MVCAERLKCVPAAFQSLKQISREPETQKEFAEERGSQHAGRLGGLPHFQGKREKRPKNKFRNLLLERVGFVHGTFFFNSVD